MGGLTALQVRATKDPGRYVDSRGLMLVIDKSGVKTIELFAACFEADEDYIFGLPNEDYIRRELEWYESQSLNVNDIPGGPPAIWKQVADPDGFINSNYGNLIFSYDNWDQYHNVLKELKYNNRESRRGQMIYTRPSIWYDYNKNGMSDFICTNTVGYLIRNDKLLTHVSMRSNDGWAGYRNDVSWQKHVQKKLANDLGVEPGKMMWSVTSLHMYEKQFKLVK